jgi:hypothetical protein
MFEYVDSNYGVILGGPRDKRKAVYRGPQFTFLPFTEKSNWSIVLYFKEPLKSISLGHPRDIEARPHYKEKMRVFFLENNRVKVLPTFQ